MRTSTNLLEWESLAELDTKWSAFMADPEWLQKRAEFHKDSLIITHVTNTILHPASFSAMK
jgi:NIPSNAP